MVKMPGEASFEEQWDPMTEAISARESKPYKPRMGTQPIVKPDPNVNPYDAFIKEGGEPARRMEADRTLGHRFTRHFMEAQLGGTKGIGQVGEIFLENDPAKKQAMIERYQFEKSQYEGLPASETTMDYIAAIGGELAGGAVDPLNLVPVAKVGTVGWRASRPFVSRVIDQSVSGAAMNAAANASLQALETEVGLREEFDPWEVAQQTAIGGVAGAGFGTIDGGIAWRQKKAADFYSDQSKLAQGLAGAPEPGKAPMVSRPAIGVSLKGDVGEPVMTPVDLPDPEEVRITALADEFIQERGLTKELVNKMPPEEQERLNAEWQSYRDVRMAAPVPPSPESLTQQFGPGRLSEAQQTLFGEVIGTRNLTPEQMAQVENHLLGGSPETVPQGKVETEGADQAQPVSQLTPDDESGAQVDAGKNQPSPLPVGPYRTFKPEELKVDAKRFQFKEGGDDAGVTDRLKGVKKWDPTKAGQTLVWESKEGEFFIADGHQRHGLATKMAAGGQDVQIPGYILREADGVSAEDARAIAAAKNVAEGTGSAIDAAKILRTRPDMGVDLPPSSALVRDAQGLAQLSDDAFGMVINKKVPAGYAAIVGKLAPDKGTHADLLGLLAKEKPENAVEAESMIRDALEAPAVQSTMEDMFGSAEVTQILFKERAQVLSAASTAIRKDRAAFSTLVREEERISGAGNKLATAANLERSQQDAEILAALQSQARRKGPVADALAAAAKRLKDGEPRQAVVRDFLGVLRGETAPSGQNRGDVGAQERPLAASLETRRTDSPAFKRWFGASKVVDEKGEPLIRYHGTDADFGAFERTGDIGFHFGTKGQAAERGGTLMPVYLKIENPFRMPDLNIWEPVNVLTYFKEKGIITAAEAKAAGTVDRAFVRDALAAKGYDGIVYRNGVEAKGEPAADSFIAFEPTQIKSVFNRGSFDPADPRIAFSGAQPSGTLFGADVKELEAAYIKAKDASDQVYWQFTRRANPGVAMVRQMAELQAATKKARDAWMAAQRTEPGAEGKPQAVIPGAERISQKAQAERQASQPMRSAKPQRDMDFGLFGDDSAQLDLLDMARQKVVPRLRPTFDQIDWRADGSVKQITVGDTSILYAVRPDGVEIQSLRTPQRKRGQGSARDAMEVMLEGADALDLTVRLWAAPLDKTTSQERLIRFYERLGFEDTGGRINGAVEMVRAPDGREMPFDEAGLRSLVSDRAPIYEIETHPLITDAVRRMAELPETNTRPNYGTPEDRASRLFDFDGELVRGTDEAVARLTESAKDFSTKGPVRQEARVTIILGPAAAGKSTIAERIAAEKYAAIVDPDEAKRVMPEYNRGIGANAVHEESSDIGNEVLTRLANARMNMVLPKVGANGAGIEKLTLALQRHGYHVEIVNLAVSYENAFRRMINRFLKTGRLIDPEYVKFVGEKPSETYRQLREKGVADGYAEIDGNGPHGEDALITEEAGSALQGIPGFRRDGLAEIGEGAGQAGRGEGAPARQSESIAARLRPEQQAQVPTNRAQSGTTGQAQPVERLEAISADLAKLASLPTPVRQGRLHKFRDAEGRSVKAAGQYDRNQGVIRLREMADFETQAHESAHALETEYGRDLAQLKAAHAAEIDQLAYPGATDVNSEGFAEWFRFYVSNPAYATRQAPSFTQAFTEMLRARNPQQLDRLENVAARYRSWTMAPSAAAVAGDIVSTRRVNMISDLVSEGRRDGWRTVIGRYFDKAYATTIDKLHPINRSVSILMDIHQEKTGERLDLRAADNPYVLARLLQDSYSAGHIDMMHGVVPYGEVRSEGPGLSDALEVALGKQYQAWDDSLMADFAAYLISRRAVHEYERFFNGEIPNTPGKFTLGDYETTIAELEAAHPEWIQAAEMTYEWERNFLTKKKDAGFIDEKTYLDLLKKPAYVPFQRDLTDIDKVNVPASGGAPGTLRQSILKAFKGSKRSVINPIESMMKDAYHTNALIKRNDVFKALGRLARSVGPGGGHIAEFIPDKELKGTAVNIREVLQSAGKAAGINGDDLTDLIARTDELLGADAMATIFRAGDINEKGEPIIYVWNDGKRQAMRLADGEFGLDLYNAMTGMSREAQNIFVSALSLPSTAVRYGITTAPHFILANYIRDQASAWVLTGNNFVPFISGAAGLRDELTQNEVTQIYNTMGGIMGGGNVAALNKGRAQRDIKALQKEGYHVRRFANIRGFAEFTELTETGTRLAVFKGAFARARNEGLSEYEAAVEAAFHSRDYIDFGRHGSHMLAARRLVPFLNASLQGLDKTIRTLAPGAEWAVRTAITPFIKHRTGMALSRIEQNALSNSGMAWAKMAAIGVAGLALSYAYRDDPEYEEISDYLRATHWMVKLGPGEWFAIPKPFEIGFMSNLFERSFDAIYGRDPIAMQNFLSGLWEVTAPPTGIPIFETFYELQHNVDGQGRPIVGPDIAGRDPWQQYNGYTSWLAKQLGELTGASPAKIDHAIQGFGASWGKIIADGSTDIANGEGIVASTANSVSRRFIRDVSRGNTSSRAFWDRMSETAGPMAQTADTYKNLYDSKGESEAERYLTTKSENQKAFALINTHFEAEVKRLHPMRRAQDMMSVISNLRRDIAGQDVVKIETDDMAAEERERIVLTPSQRQQAQEILGQLSMVEARNALIVIGEPGWAQREYMDANSYMEEMKLANPELFEEFEARIEKKKVYPFEGVRDNWPDVKERLLTERQDADLSDIVAVVK